MNRLCIAILAAWQLSISAGLCGPAMTRLATEGRPLVPIVIAGGSSSNTTAVAAELATYLSRISEAKFEVQIGDGSKGIVLGTLAEFPNPALNGALAIRGEFDGREAYAIRTEADRVLLIGAAEPGVSHAAFRFLEALGCRWFFPAKEWEVVPHERNLNVSLEETDRPRILSRRIWYGYGVFRDKGHPDGGTAIKDYEAWAWHNRMGGSLQVQTGHAWQSIIGDNQELFAAHPEYLALVKGQRKGPQLCTSNPEVRRLAVQWAFKYFERNPEREMVSLECSDGHGQCECAGCAKLGSISDRVFGLANYVAQEVARKYPGKLVGCLAYAEHSEPPSFALEPNVYVQLTSGFNEGRYTHDELVELWPKKCSNLGFYEYYSVWPWDFDRLPGGNGANITRMQAVIDRYARAGATSFSAESGNNWGLHGRGYYMASRLLWNPGVDVKALLADFYEKAFGPAAPAMKRYYERVAPDDKPLMSRSLVGDAFRDVEEAARLAHEKPEVLARLDQLKHYLQYVRLRWQFDHEKDKNQQKELATSLMTLAYRTRYEYMNHWEAMRQAFAKEAAAKFGEPGWLMSDKGDKPWLVETRVAREETEQWFREGLEYFKPTPVREIAFSNELAPVRFADTKPVASQLSFQNDATFAMRSRSGEALEMEITTGIIVAYRNRPAAAWNLSDGASNVVASGSLPLDGEVHHLAVKVPKAGTYFFDCKSSAGWKLKVEAGHTASLLNARGQLIKHLGQMQEMFFYVPKGTQALQYFWNGGPHKVMGPDRKVLAEVNVDDDIVTVPVPAGKDGQVWSLSPRAHSQLWFFNAPNVIAASPSALLVPAELAVKDALP